ncbi:MULTISPECIES: glycine cleavage system aminomethyltransferase GcvT [Paenibacillus]|uniref:aminomethyltransferase n=1 Tax=Paenibacillus cucumis (ex Kampfer et al. 2016) TaxID=1776858 RepID=A0ABS7KP57_9BACL|nr:glycine cleavage system aminomethyltransferase GcvT [Paenibacillus cucumis (ex Kampfer et al. 2016)]MBY0205903.1 glycine cleavage system aminomethyltransferase GcvT [Paenibacillus cucumis (ex Kampfer et al. 2016)]
MESTHVGPETPLFPVYAKYNAKLLKWGERLLPAQYDGIPLEYQAVRSKAGICDISHMGNIHITGKDAYVFLQYVLTNDVSVLKANQVQFTLMCNEQGGIIDDLLLYMIDEEHYMLVVNAMNINKDFQWLINNAQHYPNVEIENRTFNTAIVTIQGPEAQTILQTLMDDDLGAIPFLHFMTDVKIGNALGLISRTGFTGEDGFEIYIPKDEAVDLWESIMLGGKDIGVLPFGMLAFDHLRIESGLPLYGKEIDISLNPYEVRLGFAVKLNKSDFIGKEMLEYLYSQGVKKKLVGIQILDEKTPRYNNPIFVGDLEVGRVTSGMYSEILQKYIALAIISVDYTALGTNVWIVNRQVHLEGVIIKYPFYTSDYKFKMRNEI